jgi:hypothetical protein
VINGSPMIVGEPAVRTVMSSIVWYNVAGTRLRPMGKGSVLCLLSKPVAEGVEAEEGDDTDFAVEAL